MKARSPTRRGRRQGPSGASRAAVLRAARSLFAAHGFNGTTMRSIAARAGVDAALVHYFFGSKAELFAAAIEMPPRAAKVSTAIGSPRASRGLRLARYHLDELFPADREAIIALLRAALGDPRSLPTLRPRIEAALVDAAAAALGSGDHARLRAELAGAMMVGLFILRDILRLEPIASTKSDLLAQLVAPALDAVLVGRRVSRGRRR